MADDRQRIARTYTEYFQVFQTLDPRAVLPYFHVPCMFLSPEAVLVMTTAAEIEARFRQMMEGLKMRGYGSSELMDLRVKQLSSAIALVSVRGVRKKINGEQLERFGVTCTFLETNSSWKIVVLTAHDPDAIVAVDED